MDKRESETERQQLTEIYKNLTPALKKQLLTTAKVIETTQDIMIAEGDKKKNQKIHNQKKG